MFPYNTRSKTTTHDTHNHDTFFMLLAKASSISYRYTRTFKYDKSAPALLPRSSSAAPIDRAAGPSTGVDLSKRSEPSLALSDDYGVGFGAPRPSMNIHRTAYDWHMDG